MSELLPPYAALMGIALHEDNGDGAPVLVAPFSDKLSGRPGHLHGGAIAGLLDMAAHAALVRSLEAEGRARKFKPIGVTIDYMRGGKERATYARGRVIRIGARVATVMVEAWQDESGGPPIAAQRLHVLLAREEGS